MSALVQHGKGKKPGEDTMPARVIDQDLHDKLHTTWDSNFQKSLIQLCNQGKIHSALYLCIKDYQDQGLNLNDYKDSIKQLLREYQKLQLITDHERQGLEAHFFP